MTRRFASLVGCATVLLTMACGSARRDEPVEAEFTAANEQIALGERVFKRQCDYCHPGGDGGLGPALNNKPLPGFAMKFQIRHGLGAMPSFDARTISDAEREAIVAYLKALRKSD